MKNRELAIVGMGLHPWGQFPDKSMAEMGVVAIQNALKDANMDWREVQAMAAGAYMWISGCTGVPGLLTGTSITTMMGRTGIPIVNVVNACASGQSILREACLAVASGEYDIVCAVGTDKSSGGFFRPQSTDAKFDYDYYRYAMTGETNPAYWAMEMRKRMQIVGTTEDDMAMVKAITSKGGVGNPNARYKRVFTKEEVLKSNMVCDPLRLYEICATSDGAAALIVMPLDKALKYTKKPLRIDACTMGSASFGDPTIMLTYLSAYPRPGVLPYSESRNAVQAAYKASGRKPSDINVVELPDNSCWHYFTYLDMIFDVGYGGSEKMFREGYFNVPDGKVPVCPSGGFGAFGEATVCQGLWQVLEVGKQIRQEAFGYQIPNNPKVGLAQSYGYAGNNGVAILSKAW
jgi:acetyl-CoA acetyltransferase